MSWEPKDYSFKKEMAPTASTATELTSDRDYKIIRCY